MFHNIPEAIEARMKYLENLDSKDRLNGTPRMKRLRQIPSETGKFLSILAASAPKGAFIEIGTSAGYSTLWIALACQQRGIILTTFEILKEKSRLAKETFKLTNMESTIELIEGDARDYLSSLKNTSFCFLDAEKEIYEECYDLIIPNMLEGGLFIADNVISHYETLEPMITKAQADTRIDALIIPIGKGVLLCRRR